MAGEPNAARMPNMGNAASLGNAANAAAAGGFKVPQVDSMASSFDKLTASFEKFLGVMEKAARSNHAGTLRQQWKGLATEALSAAQGMTSAGGGTAGKSTGTVFGGPSLPSVAPAAVNAFGPAKTAGSRFAGSVSATPGQVSVLGPPAAPVGGTGNIMAGMKVPEGPDMGSLTKTVLTGGAVGGLVAGGIAAAKTGEDLIGALSGAGANYAYNRIEGSSGNRNAMLTMDQLMGRSSTMSGMSMAQQVALLSRKTPVNGSFTDVMGTLQEGGKVGAYMAGSDSRNGFYESVRQMQAFTPGVGAAKMAGALSGYMGNVKSQQMGVFLGGGAFTMMGKGGRYKSLSEWAEGITTFFKEQRPGSDRGKPFSREDLMAQNFPGSNVNAWFQQMGIPQDMVDYWWQYVMTKASAGGANEGPWSTEKIQSAVQQQRGMDISAERIRNVSQSTRREFTLGGSMRNLYGVKESADRRFNVVMNTMDQQVGNLMKSSNVGALISMLPTEISEFVMPYLLKYASSGVGGIAGIMGSLMEGKAADSGIGDPIGDTGYGDQGGTSAASLSPDLARKVKNMQRANPAIRINSGYRDTVTQNRLQRQGVGRVGPSSKSAHTRGWAADLGPTSQLGWIQANAHKFGLQTASNAGEPWHVQSAGTMPESIGDLPSWMTTAADFVGQSGMLGLGGTLAYNTVTEGLDKFQNIIKGMMGGTSGGLSQFIDTAISTYMQVLLTPLMGQTKLFGMNNLGSNEGALMDIINKPATVSLSIPGFGTGFSPAQQSHPSATSGDPIGDLGGMVRGSGPVTVSPTLLNITINLQGGASSDTEAKRTAGTLARHLDSELEARLVRKR